MFISQIIKDLSVKDQKEVLNPNMEKVINTIFLHYLCAIPLMNYNLLQLNLQMQDIHQALEVVNICKQNCTKSKLELKTPVDFEELIRRHQANLQKVPNLSNDDFISLLQNQGQRFEGAKIDEENIIDDNLKTVINAFVNEDVINLIIQKLLNTNKPNI